MSKYDTERYELKNFKANTPELIDFLDKHNEELKILKNKCWGTFFKFNKGYYKYEIHLDWHFLMLNNKIVANATIYKDQVIKSKNIDTYKLTRILNKDNKYLELYPIIGSLCRDLNEIYKGSGRYLLDMICEIYKHKGHKYIYLIPESIIYRFRDIDDDCGITKYKKEYLESQKKLISYYKRHNFKEETELFEKETCYKNDKEYNIYFPVYKKKLI